MNDLIPYRLYNKIIIDEDNHIIMDTISQELNYGKKANNIIFRCTSDNNNLYNGSYILIQPPSDINKNVHIDINNGYDRCKISSNEISITNDTGAFYSKLNITNDKLHYNCYDKSRPYEYYDLTFERRGITIMDRYDDILGKTYSISFKAIYDLLNSMQTMSIQGDETYKTYDERTKDPNDPYYVISDEELENLEKQQKEQINKENGTNNVE